MPPKSQITLTDEQRSAITTLARLRSPVQTLGGYAGTGKTTVIRHLLDRLDGFVCCAFTGKAASVLRSKGVEASTIHSLIYKPETKKIRKANGKVVTVTNWKLTPRCLFTPRGIIVDEASMVGQKIHDDLTSFGRPVIFVGDHGQLEPVEDDGEFNLMERPDITLETIHRNAGPIARFAEFIRKGNPPHAWPASQGEQIRHVTTAELKAAQAYDADELKTAPPYDQMICAFNKTRVSINKMMRDLLDYPADHPVLGDRVICLRNNPDLNLFNGQQGVISDIDEDDPYHFEFESDSQNVWVDTRPEQFHNQKAARFDAANEPFDYAYCITCHKSQGSEYGRVGVFEEFCRAWSHTRWCYTAASRAKLSIDWLKL